MEYEEFTTMFIDGLQQNMSDEAVNLTRITANKINEDLDGVSVRYPDSNVAPTVYLEDKFQMYQDGYSVDELVEQTASQLRDIRGNAPQVPELTRESAEKNLYCVLVNAEANAELLKNVPHEKFEDLAVIARFKVGEDGSFIVRNDMCQHFQMTSEEVLEIAHINTNNQHYDCKNMAEVMRDIMVSQGLPEEYVDELIDAQGMDCPMYVLTNDSKIDGSIAITSKAVLEEAHEDIGEDFYILPSSRHEVLLVPKSVVSDVNDLKTMVGEVNATEVSKADKLSDHVYKYESISKKVTIADAEKLTEENSMSKELLKSHARSH